MKHARPDYDRFQDPAGLIPEDEPVFLIRGQDRAAPAAMRAWIDEAAAQGASADIIDRVEGHLQAVIDWQDNDPGVSKVPDLPGENG
jgi:hypothetical protein